MVRKLQALILRSRPFMKEDGARVFSSEVGPQSQFEGTAEEHRCPGVFLLPAVEIAMAIAPWAGQVVADLGVAVGHQATCELSRLAGESSSQRPAGAKPSSRSREVPLKTM